LRSSKLFQKKKRKKKAHPTVLAEWMQAFRLKNFPEREKQPESRIVIGKILSETRRA
jgi:hypothetical protein